MGRYDFQSVGGAAGNAIEQFLMQRDMQSRQHILDQLARQKQEHDAKRADDELKLQREQETRVAEAQKNAQTDLEKEREFRRASTIHTNALPGVLDQPTADLLRGQGFGDIVQQGQPTQGAAQFDPTQVNEVPQYDVVPGILQTSGGTAYQQARTAASERSTQAAAAQQAAAERAAADNEARAERSRESNELRATLAATANQGHAETTALRNDLLRSQVQTAEDKKVEKAAADKRAKDAARVTSGATIDVLKQLADFDPTGQATLKPDAAGLFGMGSGRVAQYIPGSGSATASAALDRLQGRVIVDLLNEMKNQSRTGATGFGALSGPELKLLENAASQLTNRNISPARASEELARIYQLANQLYGGTGDGGGDAGGAAVVKWGRDAQGKPVRLQ